MESDNLKKRTIIGLAWSFGEKLGVQLISFVVSLLLARLLMPENYGVVAIAWVFISIAQVFVEQGFGSALIQKQNADELDFSSVFWFNMGISLLLYGALYIAAPGLAVWYDMELLCPVLRAMGLRIVMAAVNAVQRAKVSRDMEFKKFFVSALGGTLFSAVVGITMAWQGYGVWALVAQELTNLLLVIVILLFTMGWLPRLRFSGKRLGGLVNYGWKVLVSGLLDSLYENLQGLYVGKLYPAETVAFYSRGKQFPQLITDNVNTSINAVLFPAISTVQNDRAVIKSMTRRAMKTSSYCITPMMLGLAAVAEPVVALLMTEKWLPCVPLLRIMCVSYALVPLQTANQQAIYAMGRSDIVLKMNLLKKSFGVVLILIFTRISVEALAWAIVATGVFTLSVNMLPNKRMLNYGFWEQLWDILPGWLLSGAMFALVRLTSRLDLPMAPELLVMILAGMASYVGLSVLFRVDSFFYLLKMAQPWISRIRKK